MTGNALLRRVDWRFLVGMPEPQRAYCPVPGSLREAVQAVAGQLLDEPAPGRCDLAVPEGLRAMVRDRAWGPAPQVILRKEVIQPQVPLRLPCYDLVPITGFIFGACL